MGCKGSSVRITPSRPLLNEKAQSVTTGLFCGLRNFVLENNSVANVVASLGAIGSRAMSFIKSFCLPLSSNGYSAEAKAFSMHRKIPPISIAQLADLCEFI